jgi:hypothetical protein
MYPTGTSSGIEKRERKLEEGEVSVPAYRFNPELTFLTKRQFTY